MFGRDIRAPSPCAPTNKIFMYPVDTKMADEIEDGKMGYFKRVLRFCLSTTIYEKTGLTMADLLALDRVTFDYLEKEYFAFKPIEQDALKQAMQDFQNLERNNK
jgi:hypothetical protein